MAQSNQAISPFSLNQEQASRLSTAADGLSKEQLIWSSGYLAGRAWSELEVSATPSKSPVVESLTQTKLTILYGSQTGNGRAVAETFAREATAGGIANTLVDMADFSPRDIVKEQWLAVVVSTHGEGDAPDDAELLLEYLQSKRAPKLASLNYFVLALGDSSYAQFCQTGQEFDDRLAALGATRVMPRVDCDVDYEASATQWTNQALELAKEKLKPTVAVAQPVPLQVVDTRVTYSKANPFAAEVFLNQRITGSKSSKTVHHLELSLEQSGLKYEPGDSLGIITPNIDTLVDEVSLMTGAPTAKVTLDGEEFTLQEALRTKAELTLNSSAFLEQYSALIKDDGLTQKLSNKKTKQALLADYQVIDVLREWPFQANSTDTTIQAFVDTFRPLTPRVYSISSSLEATPDEVHITVAQVTYDAFEQLHFGSASTLLTQHVEEGKSLPVFIDANPRFRLPENPSTNIIMIGPGTGVAPFRAFVQHRLATDAPGKNWLFFGDRNFDEDFLYQTEWQQYLKRKQLHRLDLAFSRDQTNKVYVQDRLRENADEVYRWISEGAVIYVCGDAKKMAPDVHTALRNIIASQRGVSDEEAETYLKTLKRERRYLRDVY